MNHESMDRIPAIYTNHAEVKIGAEEIQVLFGLRDDFNGEFDGKETVKVQALPQIMMVMTFAQAHSLADTINRQLEIIRSFKDK